jgi:hypothetical protein
MNNYKDFSATLGKTIYVGKVFDNPSGKGTSIIKKIDNAEIVYIRGNQRNRIKITFEILYNVYKKFLGKQCSSNDLRRYAPNVFDSKARPAGHSCNCTFLFLIFKALSIVDKIDGDGVAGHPFYVYIKKS